MATTVQPVKALISSTLCAWVSLPQFLKTYWENGTTDTLATTGWTGLTQDVILRNLLHAMTKHISNGILRGFET